MSSSPGLTLIAPHIAPALDAAVAHSASGWPQLARLAGRGSISRLEAPPATQAGSGLSTWQLALLRAIGLEESADIYPSAAVTRSGDLQKSAAGFWMHAQPMHFAVGLDRLTALTLHGERRMSHAEREQLEPTIAAHLRASGFELVRTAAAEWLVHSEQPLDVYSVAPDVAAANPLEDVMPRGADAPRLRRLMTELQMLLHEHPVSVARLQRGAPEINAIWFHGAGELGRIDRKALPQSFGEEDYLRGVYVLNELQTAAVPSDARQLLSRISSRALAVIPTDDIDALEALWIAPLTRALATGTLARLDLILGNWYVAVQRGSMLRFWRGPRQISDWAAC